MKLKFQLGQLVYFCALDDSARWQVYGSTIIAMHRLQGQLGYVVKAKPVNLFRRQENLYTDIEAAKAACINLNKQEQKNESTNK